MNIASRLCLAEKKLTTVNYSDRSCKFLSANMKKQVSEKIFVVFAIRENGAVFADTYWRIFHFYSGSFVLMIVTTTKWF